MPINGQTGPTAFGKHAIITLAPIRWEQEQV